jgi:hypothetical protein
MASLPISMNSCIGPPIVHPESNLVKEPTAATQMFSPTANQIPMLCSLTCKSIPYHMRASGLHATMPMRKSSFQLISKPRATEPSKIRIKFMSPFSTSLNASTALIPSMLTTHIQILEPRMMYV